MMDERVFRPKWGRRGFVSMLGLASLSLAAGGWEKWWPTLPESIVWPDARFLWTNAAGLVVRQQRVALPAGTTTIQLGTWTGAPPPVDGIFRLDSLRNDQPFAYQQRASYPHSPPVIGPGETLSLSWSVTVSAD